MRKLFIPKKKITINFNFTSELNILSAFHIIFILFLLFNFFPGNTYSPKETFIISGVGSSIDEAAEIIKGIGGFINSLKTMISVFTGIIGLRAIVLFIVVSVIGGGLSFIGIPRGKTSFFLSLLVTDLFWFVWITNMSPDSIELLSRVWTIVKTNLILIIPFGLIYFFKSKSRFRRSVIRFVSGIIPFAGRNKHLKRNNVLKLTEDLLDKSLKFQKSLFNDLMNQNKNDDVFLSPETIDQKKELEELLKEIK